MKNRGPDLDGTAYGKEVQRRRTIIYHKAPDFLPKPDVGAEQPGLSRRRAPPPPLPVLPKPRP